MNIAELFVRLRGDTSDLHRKLTDAERAILGLERSAIRLDRGLKQTGLSTGRLGNQFAGLAGHIAGVHPVVGNLASVLGNFALTAGWTVAILGGLAAIAVAYDKITSEARKAKEESDKLISSLEKAIHLKGLGPGGETVDQVKAAKERAAVLKTQIATLEVLIVKDAQDADVIASNLILQEKINKLYIERQNILNAQAGGQSIVNEKVNEAIAKNTEKVKELTFGYNQLRDAAERVNAEILREKTDWWKNYIQRTNDALTVTEQLANAVNALRPSFLESLVSLGTFSVPEAAIANFDINAGLTDEQKKQHEKMGIFIEDANKNANKLHDAIWGSATQMANQIVGALNIGGGGKGSGLGGALGGTAGFAAGFMLGGPIGGAIGSTIGNIAGSLFGGLFDSHKKEVNANTQALRALTDEIHNAPSGFKIAQARYNATDVSQLGQDLRRYRSRGGKNPLLAGA